jgi:hypothetical protein
VVVQREEFKLLIQFLLAAGIEDGDDIDLENQFGILPGHGEPTLTDDTLFSTNQASLLRGVALLPRLSANNICLLRAAPYQLGILTATAGIPTNVNRASKENGQCRLPGCMQKSASHLQRIINFEAILGIGESRNLGISGKTSSAKRRVNIDAVSQRRLCPLKHCGRLKKETLLERYMPRLELIYHIYRRASNVPVMIGIMNLKRNIQREFNGHMVHQVCYDHIVHTIDTSVVHSLLSDI